MPDGWRPRTMREALNKRQREVTALQRQITTREFTPQQKELTSKLPQAEVVSRLGTVGKREQAGLSTFREANLPTPVRLLQWALRAKPERTIKIALRQKNLPAAVRHEVAHQVLNLQGVSTREHHPIISKARVSAEEGTSFRLLEPAQTAIRYGGTLEERFRRAQQRELRRRMRRKK